MRGPDSPNRATAAEGSGRRCGKWRPGASRESSSLADEPRNQRPDLERGVRQGHVVEGGECRDAGKPVTRKEDRWRHGALDVHRRLRADLEDPAREAVIRQSAGLRIPQRMERLVPQKHDDRAEGTGGGQPEVRPREIDDGVRLPEPIRDRPCFGQVARRSSRAARDETGAVYAPPANRRLRSLQ